MPDDWPVAALFAFLSVVAFGRAGATYALARGARGLGGRHTSLLERPAVVRAERAIARFGAPAVTLCFLTIGVQTAVNAAAGSLRMPLRRYVPALAVGALLWAAVYATVGLAVLDAFWSGTPWRAAVTALAIAALVALGFRTRLGLDVAAGAGQSSSHDDDKVHGR